MSVSNKRPVHPVTADQTRNPFLDLKSFGDRGTTRMCDHPDCAEAGEHRAPKSRDRLDDYYWFCRDHARAYNAQWDYFKGMSTEDIHRFQREVPAWHRPTFKRGRLGPTTETVHIHDRFDILGDEILKGRNPFAERPETARFAPEPRPLTASEREALQSLGLDMQATKADIKKAYKLLVKQYHPDANGGDRQREDMFRKISDAYRKLAAAWESRG